MSDKEYIEEAIRARTGLVLLAQAGELIEAACSEGRIHEDRITKAMILLKDVRYDQLKRYDLAMKNARRN